MSTNLTDLQRDILIKSAEGIKEGMWCRGAWFAPKLSGEGKSRDAEDGYGGESALPWRTTWWATMTWTEITEQEMLEMLGTAYRCAEGEVAYRTALAGGSYDDVRHIFAEVNAYLRYKFTRRSDAWNAHSPLPDETMNEHNDDCQDWMTADQAAEEWFEIFRAVAESE